MRQHSPISPISQQRGVALLTILLLVVAITIVAGSMLASQRVMVRQYELTQNQGKFREYALAGEAVATQLIMQDSQINQTDSFQDAWAKLIADYPVTGGQVHIEIQDEASRFNLNNLYHDGKVDTQAVNYFKALLVQNGLEPSIAMAVLDWQDPDSNTSNDGGAEADYYQSTGKALPMPIANQPFISVDELRYVRGMDEEKFQVLQPLLTAVPFYLPMNVNTVQPALLQILSTVETTTSATNPNNPTPSGTLPNQNSSSSPTDANAANTNPPSDAPKIPLNASEVANWANARKTAMPLNGVNELWQVPVFSTVTSNQQQALSSLFDVQSRAFRVFITVKVDDKQTYMTSQLAKVPQNSSTAPNASININTANAAPQVVAFNRQFLPIPIKSAN